EAGVRIRIVAHVRNAASKEILPTRLKRGPRLIFAHAATASRPSRFGNNAARAVEQKRRAANTHDVGRRRRPDDSSSIIAGRGGKGDTGLVEMGIVARLARKFGSAPAHRNLFRTQA